jgi:hypothetical protein
VSALVWTILAVCVIALIVALVIVSRRRGSSHSLRRQFGPEYDRTVEQSGDKKAAERKLADIAQRRDKLDVRPLSAGERAEYTARWDTLQTQFVDDPATATQKAETLISDVMRTRGYPESSFDERAELISADRPDVVGAYRQAHVEAAAKPGSQGTEALRDAFVHYRELFGWLTEDTDKGRGHRRDESPAMSGQDSPA